jgi:hypothetical protein
MVESIWNQEEREHASLPHMLLKPTPFSCGKGGMR